MNNVGVTLCMGGYFTQNLLHSLSSRTFLLCVHLLFVFFFSFGLKLVTCFHAILVKLIFF